MATTTCPHDLPAAAARLRAPTASSRVFKDECLRCFDSPDQPDGIYVCLGCFHGGCGPAGRDHAALHARRAAHPLALNIRRSPKPRPQRDSPPPQKITKLAIQQDNESDKFDIVTKIVCVPCGAVEVDHSVAAASAPCVEGILKALSAKKQSEIQAWEEETLRPCSHVENLEQVASHNIEAKALAHCIHCNLQENLWLCLTCGSLGCGRKQYGGTGGNGHALTHHELTGHPIAVKMGSITPEGTADLFCYNHGDEIMNPNLGSHLASFGINLLSQQKTEKSIAELQLEQNLKFDFSMTTEDGKQLKPLFGPGFTGLKNLGNSCYMASILQTVFAIDTIGEHYLRVFSEHSTRCSDAHADCFMCQMGKLADGLLSGRYSKPTTTDTASSHHHHGDDHTGDIDQHGQDGIAPSMFKSVIGKSHSEFSTMRQQDAQEFLQHLLTTIEQKERVGGNDPSTVFRFSLEQRLQCLECERVGYTTIPSSGLILPVPAQLVSEFDGKKVYEGVSLERCLDDMFAQDIRQFRCPHDERNVSASFIQRVKVYPRVLVLTASRFVLGQGWVMEKLNVELRVPMVMDLGKYRSTWPHEGEVLLPKDDSVGGNGGGGGGRSAPAIDQAVLDQLIAMGFPENRCKRAIVKTGNAGAEVAMGWLFEHMDDADIDAPLEEETAFAGPAISESDVSQLMDMGFTSSQAKRALRETQCNMERAVDWLFSHADDPVPDEAAVTATDTAAAGAATTATSTNPAIDTGSTMYELFAFVAHRGTSAHCGHYVTYIRRNDMWVLFNDNKVVDVPDVSACVGEGYIYFYKQK